MKYDLLVFDWDGTLYDSSQYIVDNVQQAFKEMEMAIPNPNIIRSMIGLNFTEALRRVQQDITPAQLERLTKIYRRLVSAGANSSARLFPGAKETLIQLKDNGYTLAIATGKSRSGLNADLEYFSLKKYFTTSRCGDETFSKPHPQMLLDILETTAYEPNQTLMIGDTSYDMELAQNAKVDAVAVSYGVHTQEDLKQFPVKAIIHDIGDLPIWLSSVN